MGQECWEPWENVVALFVSSAGPQAGVVGTSDLHMAVLLPADKTTCPPGEEDLGSEGRAGWDPGPAGAPCRVRIPQLSDADLKNWREESLTQGQTQKPDPSECLVEPRQHVWQASQGWALTTRARCTASLLNSHCSSSSLHAEGTLFTS